MQDVLTYKSVAKVLNDLTFRDYYNRLELIARSVFKWNNLPNGMDEKWIERYLFEEGRCVFFHDKDKSYAVAKVTDSGQVNMYDEPTDVSPVATNYTYESLKNDKQCVVIRNNDIEIPTSHTIKLYALRLTEITRTIDVNVNAQKTPKIALCSEKQRQSMKKVIKQTDDNELVIFGDNILDIDSIKVLDVNAPIVFDKLQVQKHAIWNEAMTYLGANNANQDKKERLVADEVSANNEQVNISADVMLKARERACERINKLFNLDISVELRKPGNITYDLMQQAPRFEVLEGGTENVS